VISAVNEKKPGDEITLTVINADGQRDVTVKLGDRPANAQQ
jgi:S1-C subfamily serine protease